LPHTDNKYSNYDQFLIGVNCTYSLLHTDPVIFATHRAAEGPDL